MKEFLGSQTPAVIMHNLKIKWWQRANYLQAFAAESEVAPGQLAITCNLSRNVIYDYLKLAQALERRPSLRLVTKKRTALAILRSQDTNRMLANYIRARKRKIGLEKLVEEYQDSGVTYE